jgi:hypothetical protein
VNRSKTLAIATFLLLAFAVVHYIWANWGLVTVHAREVPLGKVIASIQRQGHAHIATDMPLDTPVTMDVDKVPVTDALETLSINTDSRWHLVFLAAPDKSAIKTAELTWFGGQKPDDWTLLSFGFGGNMFSGDESTAPPDPRGDLWNPKTAAPAPVQTFFGEAVQATNASFAFPTAWNPTVSKVPASGEVGKIAPKLISLAGGKYDQVFLVSKNVRRGPRPDGTAAIQPDLDLLAERAQNQINRLPPDQRGDAQAAFDAEQNFRKSLAGLSDADRAQAWAQHMQDPNVQQQMANRMDAQDARMNHDQRMQRIQNYVNRKMAAMGKN